MTADEYCGQQENRGESPQLNEVGAIRPHLSPPAVGEELQRGVNREWMRMARIRSQVKAKWGNSPVNARFVEAETRRRYLQGRWG